jgi:hypothetical protein
MPNISDEEYAFLQGRRQVADFSETLYNDPALNNDLKGIIKKKYPAIQIPDYDIEQKFNQRLDAEKKERDNEKRQQQEAADQEKFKKAREDIQNQYGFTDEGMKDLEDFMVKRNIGDYEVAASYQAAKNPKLSEAEHGNGRWNHSKMKGFADISKDPEGWAENEILGAIRRDADRTRNAY